MKFNIKYTIAALSVFMFTAGCDDKLDAIDVIGYTGVPVAIETVTSEPLKKYLNTHKNYIPY